MGSISLAIGLLLEIGIGPNGIEQLDQGFDGTRESFACFCGECHVRWPDCRLATSISLRLGGLSRAPLWMRAISRTALLSTAMSGG
jgi:hypothetical protein